MRTFATNVLRSLRGDPGASIAAGITACVTVFSVTEPTEAAQVGGLPLLFYDASALGEAPESIGPLRHN